MTQPAANPERDLAEWQALAARFPLTSPWLLAPPLLSAIAANATLCWLVASQQISPFELVLLVALEALLLAGIVWLQHRAVPAAARLDAGKPVSWKERLGLGAFALVWLSGAYGVVLLIWLQQLPQLQAFWADPLGFLGQSKLWLPLGFTLLGASVDTMLDRQHWRQHGGYFVSTTSMIGAARWLTLFLGGIPFVIPLFLIVFAFNQLLERLHQRTSQDSLAPLFLVPVLALAVFGTMGWLLQAGLSGFAIGYCTAKLAADCLIVFTPWISHEGKQEASAKAEGKPVKKGVLPD